MKIKFRQPIFNPDGSFKEFHYWGVKTFQGKPDEFDSPAIGHKVTQASLSQLATAFTDKLGNEVYMGDIVRINIGKKSEFVAEVCFNGCYFFLSSNTTKLKTHRVIDMVRHGLVIGNTYELSSLT